METYFQKNVDAVMFLARSS